MTEITRVLLADNHQLLHGSIRNLLAATPDLELVGEAAIEEELWQYCRESPPDVLLLASNVTNSPLPETLAQVKQHCPNIRVLVLLVDPEEVCLQALTENGADGGILKSEPPESLLAAIRTLAQGQPWFSPLLLKRMLQPETPPLTNDELTLLRLLVAGETEKAIAGAMNLSQRTVRRRIDGISKKLGVKTRTELAYQAGLRRLLKE
ncbi:MAG: response regulator transcription factor, partial [Anaerolineae bacterium]